MTFWRSSTRFLTTAAVGDPRPGSTAGTLGDVRRLVAVAAALLLMVQGLQFLAQAPTPLAEHEEGTNEGNLSRPQSAERPLLFEANRGQVSADVDFTMRGNDLDVALKSSVAEMTLQGSDGIARLQMSFVGGNEAAQAVGANAAEVETNYFIGDQPDKWIRNIPSFGAVRYEGVYPGTDAVFHVRNDVLEYDFVLQPGASPSKIALDFAGAQGLRLDGAGNLVVRTSAGELTQAKPVAYQGVGKQRVSVPAHFVISSSETVHLAIGDYDSSKKLVIDPTIEYSTFIGGNNEDVGRTLALDGDGNAYVWGTTRSDDFPTTATAFEPDDQPNEDAFLAKFNEDGDPVYVTYLGGSNTDSPPGMPQRRLMGVDEDGNAVVAGNTFSTDFPTMDAFDDTLAGTGEDAFVTKFDSSGALVYSTYLGGSLDDGAFGVDVDEAGNAFITGQTESIDDEGTPGDDEGFPVTAGAFQETFQGGAGDAFVTALDPDGAAIYSTYLGGATNCANCPLGSNGSADEMGRSVATDGEGNAFVTGPTLSSDFPTMNAFDDTNNGASNTSGGDAFVTGFDPTGALLYSTYLGGNAEDVVVNIDAAPNGDAFVTGALTIGEQLGDATFPKANAFDSSCRDTVEDPGDDEDHIEGFVAGFESDGQVIYSSCLGGNDSDSPKWIAVDEDSHAYVTGRTDSTKRFPLVNAFDDRNRPPREECEGDPPVCNTDTDEEPSDAFVTKIDPDAEIGFSTYMGGDGNDVGLGIAPGPRGRVFATGRTAVTDREDFPTTADTRRNFRGNSAWLAVFEGPGRVLTSSYLDGHGGQSGLQILGDLRNAYVMGWHEFDANEGEEANFPMRNAHDNEGEDGTDEVFLTKLGIPDRLCSKLRAGENLVAGTDDPDVLVGTPGDDLICGFAGADVARGRGGDDRIFLAKGADRSRGGQGKDVTFGGAGGDVIRGGLGGDRLLGEEGNDKIFGSKGSDTVLGGGGDDRLLGGSEKDVVKGGNGDDFVRGTTGNDKVFGSAGADRVRGGPGGDDMVSGGAGPDNVHSGDGDDTLKGNGGDDVVRSLRGDDSLSGGGGDDFIRGGLGNDNLRGNAGNDNLLGEAGNDSLNGGAGTDSCNGGAGINTVTNCE